MTLRFQVSGIGVMEILSLIRTWSCGGGVNHEFNFGYDELSFSLFLYLHLLLGFFSSVFDSLR